VGTQTADEIVEKILHLPEGTKAYVMAPVERRDGEEYDALWDDLRATGFSRVRVDGKSVSLDALTALRQSGRALVVYHHHTRQPGGHAAELGRWADRLRARGFDRVDALRASPYSPRAFFLLDANDEMRAAAAALAGRWHGMISWHANPTLLEDPGWRYLTGRTEDNGSL